MNIAFGFPGGCGDSSGRSYCPPSPARLFLPAVLLVPWLSSLSSPVRLSLLLAFPRLLDPPAPPCPQELPPSAAGPRPCEGRLFRSVPEATAACSRPAQGTRRRCCSEMAPGPARPGPRGPSRHRRLRPAPRPGYGGSDLSAFCVSLFSLSPLCSRFYPPPVGILIFLYW